MSALVLTMPVPPSVNSAWRNVPGKGRVRTGAYKVWATAAGWALKAQRIVGGFDGPVSVAIECRRDRSTSDIDNRIKPVLDLLTTHGVLTDDRLVVRVSAEWAAVEECRVTITPAGEAA